MNDLFSQKRTLLMGIVNVTPDSFSDGGLFLDAVDALKKIEELKKQGADIIDIGAQSSAGQKAQVSEEEEWERLEPVLSQIDDGSIFISIDSYRARIAEKALQFGVQMINDVTALRGDPQMIDVLLQFKPYICLMHNAYETPYAGDEWKSYADVMKTIKNFLKERTGLLIQRGFPQDLIIIDPGMGRFLSNDPKVSIEVMDRLSELKELGFPILI